MPEHFTVKVQVGYLNAVLDAYLCELPVLQEVNTILVS